MKTNGRFPDRIAPVAQTCDAVAMRLAETVTFGGGGLDRAAVLRRTATDLATRPDARAVLIWHGKPCIDASGLVRVPMDHDVLQGAGSDPMFLGQTGDGPLFACELTNWHPDDLDGVVLSGFSDPSEQHHPSLPDDAVFAELRRIMTRLSPFDAEVAATMRAIFNWHRSHRYCAACGGPSKVAQAGWQRDCPACGAHHFPRTDPVVIMLVTHGNDVLLGRSRGWPDGMYSLLAGFVEPGETLEAAVRREVLEETNVRCGPVDYLASQPWAFPSSLMFGCRTEATTRDITLDPAELEDALWISRERLANVFAGEDATILPARKGAIAHFLLQNWLADRLD